jgi:hypothetical protein
MSINYTYKDIKWWMIRTKDKRYTDIVKEMHEIVDLLIESVAIDVEEIFKDDYIDLKNIELKIKFIKDTNKGRNSKIYSFIEDEINNRIYRTNVRRFLNNYSYNVNELAYKAYNNRDTVIKGFGIKNEKLIDRLIELYNSRNQLRDYFIDLTTELKKIGSGNKIIKYLEDKGIDTNNFKEWYLEAHKEEIIQYEVAKIDNNLGEAL